MEVKKILVPVDFSHISTKLLQCSALYSEKFGARITFLHIVDERIHFPQYIDYLYPDFLPQIAERQNLRDDFIENAKKMMLKLIEDHLPSETNHDYEVLDGLPYMKILEYAEEGKYDMIIIGSHGSSGLKHLLLGSVVDYIVHHSPLPVLVVRVDQKQSVEG